MKICCLHTSWYGNNSIFFLPTSFLSYCLFKSRQWMLDTLPRSYTDHSPSLCWVCIYIKLPSVTVHPFMAWCLAKGLFYLYQEENSFRFFILSIACIEHCPCWIRETFMAVSNCKENGREWQGVLLDNTVCYTLYSTGGVWMKCKYGTLAHDYWHEEVVVEKPVTLSYYGVLSVLKSRASFCRNHSTCSHV